MCSSSGPTRTGAKTFRIESRRGLNKSSAMEAVIARFPVDATEQALKELAKTDIYAAISEAAANSLREPTADGLEHAGDVRHVRNLLRKDPDQAKRWDYEVMVGASGALITRGTPLHYAAHLCLPKVAEVLLEFGADPNARSEEQPNSPLEEVYRMAAETDYDWCYPKEDDRLARVVDVLTRHGADPNHLVQVRGGMPGLYYSVYFGFLGIARALLAHGADVNANYKGKTALDAAWEAGDEAARELLLRAGAKSANDLQPRKARPKRE